MISNKIDPRSGSKKERRNYGKVRNNKTMPTIWPFIRILHLKQQSNILRCFYRLRFEKVTKISFSALFRSKMKRIK